jgi:hypothetical protein
MSMNLAENFVSDVCKRTFLSLWSFPNPQGKKGKELCDLLVVCDPYIVIFSVKHIQIEDSGNEEVDAERWNKRAIEDSVAQIYGAERYTHSVDKIILKDKKTEIVLPEKSKRIVHRIAVAIGRGEKYHLVQGDFDKGYVHVFDEQSFFFILKELDTITDFINYLVAKEEFTGKASPLFSKEEDLLGYYIRNGRTFPNGTDFFIVDNNIWSQLSKNEQYQGRIRLNRISYLWDDMIEILSKDYGEETQTNVVDRNQLESVLRTMVKENRLARRILSTGFQEFVSGKNGARFITSPFNSDVAYVYLTAPLESRETRVKELQMRCLVARRMHQECKTVIGIATEPYRRNSSFTLDFCSIEIQEWDEESEKMAKDIQDEFGYFRNPNIQYSNENEYPE